MIVNRVFQSKPPPAAAASTPVGKSRIDGGEEPEGRPVEVGPAPRRHPDKAVVREACGRHRHRRALGLAESEPQVLDGERRRQSRRAVPHFDNLYAVSPMDPRVEEGVGETSNARWPSAPPFRIKANTSPMHSTS